MTGDVIEYLLLKNAKIIKENPVTRRKLPALPIVDLEGWIAAIRLHVWLLVSVACQTHIPTAFSCQILETPDLKSLKFSQGSHAEEEEG